MFTSVASRLLGVRRAAILAVVFAGLWTCVGLLFAAQPVFAAQTVPYKINYQGRLTNSTGTQLADGTYNMKLRLYTATSGGTLVWSETRDASTQLVTVTGGQFAIQLGDVAALSPSLFTSQPLYLEVELPTPATATCNTVGCASWTEGAMTPRQSLASSAYAMNADTVDGIDGSSLARNDTANTFSANNTFNGTVTLGSTNASNKFVINDNSSNALFTADTVSTIVKVGTTSAATLANVRLLTTSAEFSGAIRIGSATNGIDIAATGITLNGTAQPTRTVTLSPEYPGATFRGSGTSNTGTLSSDFCSNTAGLSLDTTTCATSGSAFNYYQWTTAQSTAQTYDVYVRYTLPSDYATGSLANLKFSAQSSASGQPVSLSLYDNTGTLCSTVASFTDAAAPNWAQGTTASPIGSCTGLAANSYVTLKVHLTAVSNGTTRAGDISFQYRSQF